MKGGKKDICGDKRSHCSARVGGVGSLGNEGYVGMCLLMFLLSPCIVYLA